MYMIVLKWITQSFISNFISGTDWNYKWGRISVIPTLIERYTNLISDFVNIKTKWNSLHHIITTDITDKVLPGWEWDRLYVDYISQWSAGATMLNINNYTLSLVLAPVKFQMARIQSWNWAMGIICCWFMYERWTIVLGFSMQ